MTPPEYANAALAGAADAYNTAEQLHRKYNARCT